MAVIETDFSEYPDGVPADWTDFWGTGDFTYPIETGSSSYPIGSKQMKFETHTSDVNVLTWDELGVMSDVSAIAKYRAVYRGGFCLHVRVGGTAGDEDSYFLRVTTSSVILCKYKDGAYTVLDSKVFIPITNAEYWMKIQAIGTAIKAKFWRADCIEPGEWHFEETDSDVASGYVGVGTLSLGRDFDLDYFGANSSEISMPEVYEDDVYVGTTSIAATLDSVINYARAQGGYFVAENRKLTGVRVWCEDLHGDQIRIGVYSGGSLVTGPQGSTLLKDFGLTGGSGTSEWVEITTEDDIDIPTEAPLWIVVKGDNASGFETNYETDAMHCGDFQIARGATLVTAIIGQDPDVAYPATFPAGTDTFGNFWFTLEILTEEAPAGWTGKICGVTNPAKVNGIAVANIAKINGV